MGEMSQKVPKVGLTREGGNSAELAGEMAVEGHVIRIVIYGKDGENATYTGNFSPEFGLPGGWSAT